MPHAEESTVESERSTLRRKRERGSHDLATIEAILDAGLVCHVGFVDAGSVFVLPTTYARVGDSIYLHGAAANNMLKVLASGAEACVTVTILDGLVLARSAFHHSMNYRCVTLFGSAEAVTDESDKREALLAIVDHMLPGRAADTRPPTSSELRSTSVVRFPVREGSAKTRVGPPIDEPEDEALPLWAGQLPVELAFGRPVADEGRPKSLPVPEYLVHRGGR